MKKSWKERERRLLNKATMGRIPEVETIFWEKMREHGLHPEMLKKYDFLSIVYSTMAKRMPEFKPLATWLAIERSRLD